MDNQTQKDYIEDLLQEREDMYDKLRALEATIIELRIKLTKLLEVTGSDE